MTLQQLIVLAVQVSIRLIVFGFGLQATRDDVVDVVRRPGRLMRSLLALFVIMPIVAVVLATAFEFRPPVAIALVALAISPIPPILPRKQIKAGGRESFALGLMVTAGLLSIVLTPLLLAILDQFLVRSVGMAPSAIARVVLITILLPLMAGYAVQSFLPLVAERIAGPVMLAGKWLLIAAGLIILAGSLGALGTLIGNGTIAVLVAFVGVGLAVGHVLGGPLPDDRIVLALSTACRHPGVAVALASANFPEEPLTTAAILLYLLVNLVASLVYIKWQHRGAAA